MANRTVLKAQLRNAWKYVIEHYYRQQLINSESGLQAFLCSSLLDRFRKDGFAQKRRIFIEPSLTVGPSNQLRKPDIVICNTRSIIGVVELKYKPKGRAGTKKDLETLEWMASHPKGILVQNDRYLGVAGDDRSYSLASDAVLCWAGVHMGMTNPVADKVSTELRRYFIELHAVTRADKDPVMGRHSR